MPLIVKVALPVLFNVIVCPALVDVTFCAAKVKVEAVSAPRGALPVPVKAMACGLPETLSVMLTDAERLPEAVGVKVTLIEQLLPTATGLPQVLLSAKSPEFVPVTPTVLMFSVALPVLFTVTTWAALVVPTDCDAKVRLEAVRLTTGPDPVPVKPIVCGLPKALSVILTEALRLPSALGVNVTVTVQSTPAVNVPGQVLDSEKSPGFAPATLRARDCQIGISRIGQSNRLRGAGRSHGLAGERQRGG